MRPALLLAARVLTFATSPARDPAPELLESPVAPGQTFTTPFLTAFSCVDRGAVREVRACTLEQLAKADANGDFVAPPRTVADAAPDPAAEASAFYHAARARTFFERLAAQSLPNAVTVVAGLRVPDDARPDAKLEPFSAAFYLRAGELPAFDRIYGTKGGTVWLGRGATRDIAYDGDIVAHEMTHAMLDGVLHARGFRVGAHGASVEPEALSEALADYFAAAMSDEPTLGEWASGDAAGAYRSLETVATCPGAIDGRSHDESLMFSGALWSTRQSLQPAARAAFDGAVYRAVARTPARTDIGFADVVNALEPAAPIAKLRSELDRRQVGCAPIIPFEGSLRAALGAFLAPGTDATGTEIAPGILQLRVELPAGTTGIAVDFEVASSSSPLLAPARAPFAPIVLASWDSELRWDRGRSSAKAEASALGEVRAHADLVVPAGTRVAYLQIANRGQSDGTYDYVTLRMTSDVPSGSVSAPPVYYARGSDCSFAGERPRSGGGGGAILLASVLAALTARRSRGGAARRRSSASTSSTRPSPSDR